MRPPFEYSAKIVELLSQVTFLLGKVQTKGLAIPNPKLRKENRIRTIFSTLAIEGNTLTEEQISEVLEGKKVVGTRNEILEVKNTIKLYEDISKFSHTNIKDFLKAHGVHMKGLVSKAGQFRTKGVGIFKGEKVIHPAPKALLVPELMEKLFNWASKDNETHFIIKSCVLHYEIEFIHPFMDGNGRMGRFWQTLVLSNFDAVFKYLPLETMIKAYQEEYYEVLEKCDKAGNSTLFIEFLLKLIIDALNDFINNSPATVNKPSTRLELARHIFGKKQFSRKEYISVVPEISTATASRDLKKWVESAELKKQGENNKTIYKFI